MEVVLRASVPIEITVDTDSKQITRVVVTDEEVTYLPRAEEYTTPAGAREVPPEVQANALKIAEDGDWPAWEFGF